ncbi:hypothetical protein [Methanosarcina siciliae]|nr:hypothetical protein [Methanosarcina siciliae]
MDISENDGKLKTDIFRKCTAKKRVKIRRKADVQKNMMHILPL